VLKKLEQEVLLDQCCLHLVKWFNGEMVDAYNYMVLYKTCVYDLQFCLASAETTTM